VLVTDARRQVPRTDTVLADPRLAEATARLGRDRVKAAVVARLEEVRRQSLAPDQVVAAVLRDLPAGGTSLRPVINATGVVVHTNLGRAPLSASALEALGTAAGATDVELDLATGRRGRRGAAAVAALVAAVPAAEAGHVVNNGAAALGLVAAVLGRGRRVVVARGELVEIGDGFRIPELVESFGAELREAGTTNRVRFEDYQRAVDDSVAFVLKVHPSNFRVDGFTSSVDIATLAGLPVPVVADTGSGLLRPHPRLPDEPDADTTLRAGAALVTSSGDKLLGGPQCGLVLGRAELVERLRRHPMARALRVDKLTLAALEATLTGGPTPVQQALATAPAELLARARALAAALGAEAVESVARVGGGGAPGVELPSAALALPAGLAEPLRTGPTPVLGRVHEDRLLLDLIAVPPEDDERLAAAVRAVREG
jgi:L-seryl-tRNA(Ser) seleniumtransferase